MPIYINGWEYISSTNMNFAEFFNKNGDGLENKIYPLSEPIDLYEYIEKRGSKWKDNFTKLSSYIAKKLCIYETNPERLGVILATEYGNLNSMCKLSTLGVSSTEPISAQLFPNATLSSAAVTIAINLQAKGFNATINSGVSSFHQAIMLSSLYIKDNKLDYCIILTGDDYNDFAVQDVQSSGIKVEKFLSSINGVLISKNKVDGRKNYIIDSVDMNYKSIKICDDCVFAGGYRVINPSKNIVTPDVYIGPSIGFAGLLNCIKKLDEEKSLHTCSSMVIDNTLCSSITISKENENAF